MDKILKEKFIEIINKQKNEYLKIKNLILEEEKNLKDKEIEKLENIVKEQEKILKNITTLENKKNVIYNQILDNEGIKNKEIKLNEFLTMVDKSDANDIEKTMVELIDVIKEIDSVNSKNIHLIKNYLDFVNFTKEIKERDKKVIETTYSPKGEKKKGRIQDNTQIDRTI